MVCCVPERHENGDFTQAGTTFTFPRSFHKEVNFLGFGAAMRSNLKRKRKCASLTCFRREDSRKYLNERMLARNAAVP